MAVTKGLPRVVRKLCLWCQGQSWRLVKECPQSGCPLHTCRLGGDGDGQLLGCLQAFCLDCAGSQEAVEACTADLPMGGQCPCPAHPFRSLFFRPQKPRRSSSRSESCLVSEFQQNPKRPRPVVCVRGKAEKEHPGRGFQRSRCTRKGSACAWVQPSMRAGHPKPLISELKKIDSTCSG